MVRHQNRPQGRNVTIQTRHATFFLFPYTVPASARTTRFLLLLSGSHRLGGYGVNGLRSICSSTINLLISAIIVCNSHRSGAILLSIPPDADRH
jgi:hypothetical protein